MKENCGVYLNNERIGDENKGEFFIDIAETVDQIEVNVQLASEEWCQITVYDQSGSRGRVLKTHMEEEVSGFIGEQLQTTSATMISGPIRPGIWQVAYEFSGNIAKDFSVFISVHQHNQAKQVDKAVQDIMKNPPERPITGWVKGDMHTHTVFSDGKMTCSDNIKSALNQTLDFFVATDHQVVTHHWPKSDVAIYAGTELTTPLGHANFLGITHLLRENHGTSKECDKNDLLQLIKNNNENGLFSVNHPFLAPWDWQLNELPLELVDAIEICNDPTFSDNTVATEKALKLWSNLWNDGWKIAGVGGSDSHLLPTETYPNSDIPSLIGDPATYVYVEKLERQKLLAAIKSGKTSLSRTGKILFSSVEESVILPGQQITKTKGMLEVAIEKSGSVLIEWVLDGKVVQVDEGEKASYAFVFEPSDYHWLRVDIRNSDGSFLGTITPVYWKDKKSKFVVWEEACDGID